MGFPRIEKNMYMIPSNFLLHVKVKDNCVWLPKVGWVRIRNREEIEGTIKQAGGSSHETIIGM